VSLVPPYRDDADIWVSLALAEMKLLLREVYSKFSTLPDSSMTTESMEMSDQLISSRPLAQRCLLKFLPIEDGNRTVIA
jgi:hypothetical protein